MQTDLSFGSRVTPGVVAATGTVRLRIFTKSRWDYIEEGGIQEQLSTAWSLSALQSVSVPPWLKLRVGMGGITYVSHHTD